MTVAAAYSSLSNEEIRELLGATLHGPLPTGTMSRVFATLSEVPGLRSTASRAKQDLPVPVLLWCPGCGERHIDDGEFATKPHHTHACQSCGLTWRPAVVSTVGVAYLPGFKNAENTVREVVTNFFDQCDLRASLMMSGESSAMVDETIEDLTQRLKYLEHSAGWDQSGVDALLEREQR